MLTFDTTVDSSLHWSSETEIHLVKAHQRLELLREELHVLGHGVITAGGEDAELHQVALRHGIKIVNIGSWPAWNMRY